MRVVLACCMFAGALAACTDAADVPTTVAHVHITATCAPNECELYPEVFYNDCGPAPDSAIMPTTRSIEVMTNTDAVDISGYIQVQYTSDRVPPAAQDMVFVEEVLTREEKHSVYTGYGYAALYQLTAAGEISELDTTKLVAAQANTLQFAYTADGVSVVEDHVIDAPRTITIATDDPGISDACCSAGRPRELGLVVLVLAFVLVPRRRKK
ncbi:MAG TPA: hypothetical protein VIV11_29830 [Kofleriaceae bacterium]